MITWQIEIVAGDTVKFRGRERVEIQMLKTSGFTLAMGAFRLEYVHFVEDSGVRIFAAGLLRIEDNTWKRATLAAYYPRIGESVSIADRIASIRRQSAEIMPLIKSDDTPPGEKGYLLVRLESVFESLDAMSAKLNRFEQQAAPESGGA